VADRSCSGIRPGSQQALFWADVRPSFFRSGVCSLATSLMSPKFIISGRFKYIQVMQHDGKATDDHI
jgi:hypothetical protein